MKCHCRWSLIESSKGLSIYENIVHYLCPQNFILVLLMSISLCEPLWLIRTGIWVWIKNLCDLLDAYIYLWVVQGGKGWDMRSFNVGSTFGIPRSFAGGDDCVPLVEVGIGWQNLIHFMIVMTCPSAKRVKLFVCVSTCAFYYCCYDSSTCQSSASDVEFSICFGVLWYPNAFFYLSKKYPEFFDFEKFWCPLKWGILCSFPF